MQKRKPGQPHKGWKAAARYRLMVGARVTVFDDSPECRPVRLYHDEACTVPHDDPLMVSIDGELPSAFLSVTDG